MRGIDVQTTVLPNSRGGIGSVHVPDERIRRHVTIHRDGVGAVWCGYCRDLLSVRGRAKESHAENYYQTFHLHLVSRY